MGRVLANKAAQLQSKHSGGQEWLLIDAKACANVFTAVGAFAKSQPMLQPHLHFVICTYPHRGSQPHIYITVSWAFADNIPAITEEYLIVF